MPKHVCNVEVITDVGHRRRWSAAEKLRVVEETLDDHASISMVARRNGAAPNLLYRWQRLILEGGSVALTEEDNVTSNRVVREMDCKREASGLGGPFVAQQRIRELERQLGRKMARAIGPSLDSASSSAPPVPEAEGSSLNETPCRGKADVGGPASHPVPAGDPALHLLPDSTSQNSPRVLHQYRAR